MMVVEGDSRSSAITKIHPQLHHEAISGAALRRSGGNQHGQGLPYLAQDLESLARRSRFWGY
jgi:hypothetical protein